MKQFNKEKNSAGFTLTELLVIVAIISLMSTLMVVNYRSGERQFALQGSAHKLAQDLRRTEETAMSMRQFNCPSGTLKGYGITFEAGAESYSLIVSCGDTPPFPVLETISLDKGVKIKALSPSDPLDIFFYPPDPEVDFGGGNKATITLYLENEPENIKIISVNKSGLITIE